MAETMDRDAILKKIETLRRELEADQADLLRSKIMERPFHLHRSSRNPLTRRLIESFRKRLMLEMELVFEPLLNNQREINLRFLEEIERLKRLCLSQDHPDSESYERKAARSLQKSDD